MPSKDEKRPNFINYIIILLTTLLIGVLLLIFIPPEGTITKSAITNPEQAIQAVSELEQVLQNSTSELDNILGTLS